MATTLPTNSLAEIPTLASSSLTQADRLALGSLALLTLLLGVFKAAAGPFWSDELATVHIAQAPTWAGMLRRSQLADLNPPLEPTLVRLSCHLLGFHELAARLPSVLGFTIALLSLFLLLRRRLTLPWALFGALLPLVSLDISFYLVATRPYAVLLGSLGVAIVCYERICFGEAQGPVVRLALALACSGLLLSHIFGSYAMAGFLLAEAIRTLRKRSLDPLTWAALLLPLLCCLTYVPLIRSQSAGIPLVYAKSSRTSMRSAVKLPYELLFTPVSVLFKIAFLLIFFLPFKPRVSFARFVSTLPEDWALLLSLLAMPLIVAGMFHLRAPYSAFYSRYSLAVIYPGYLLLVGLLAWRAGDHRLIGILLAGLAFAGVLYTFRDLPREIPGELRNGLLRPPAGVTSDGGVSTVRPELPLVMDNAFRFLEASYQLPPATAARMIYVTDNAEALRLTHQNAREVLAGTMSFFDVPQQVVPVQPFLAGHPQFLLLTMPKEHDWFWRDLNEHHAGMQLVARPDFAGELQELWLVTLPTGLHLP